MFKTILLFIACLVCFTACKKDNGKTTKEPVEYKLDAEGLKYVQLKLGQYFIYRDSATGVTDSVVVTVSSLTKETGPWMGEEAIREKFHLKMAGKRPVYDSVWIDGYAEAYDHSNNFYLGYGMSILYFGKPCGTCIGVSSLASMTVEGKTYSNVVMVENVYGNDSIMTYYWAPSVGLIKCIWQVNVPFKRTVFTLLRNS